MRSLRSFSHGGAVMMRPSDDEEVPYNIGGPAQGRNNIDLASEEKKEKTEPPRTLGTEGEK